MKHDGPDSLSRGHFSVYGNGDLECVARMGRHDTIRARNEKEASQKLPARFDQPAVRLETGRSFQGNLRSLL